MIRTCFDPVAFLSSVCTKEPLERNIEGEREGEGGPEREGGDIFLER